MIEAVIMFVGSIVIYQLTRVFLKKRYNYELPRIPSRFAVEDKEKHRVGAVILILSISIGAILGGILGMLIEYLFS